MSYGVQPISHPSAAGLEVGPTGAVQHSGKAVVCLSVSVFQRLETESISSSSSGLARCQGGFAMGSSSSMGVLPVGQDSYCQSRAFLQPSLPSFKVLL